MRSLRGRPAYLRETRQERRHLGPPGSGERGMSWTAGEDAAMREYREEGARRLAKHQPKGAQPGPSLPPRVSRNERERDRDDG